MVNSEHFPEKPVEKPGRKQTLAQSDEVVMRTLDFISESSILTVRPSDDGPFAGDIDAHPRIGNHTGRGGNIAYVSAVAFDH